MLIAEDLLLLLTDDDTGKLVVSGAETDVALAGALLIDLTLYERVGLAAPDEEAKEGTVVVRDSRPTGDPLLDEVLGVLGTSKPRKPRDVLGRLGKSLRPRLYDRLAEQGIVQADKGRVLGIFPSHTWPERDASHERRVRQGLVDTLVRGIEPDPRVASLVALLEAVHAVPKVIDPQEHGVSKTELTARAREIADGSWGSKAVRQALDAMVAAVVAATTVVVVPGGGST